MITVHTRYTALDQMTKLVASTRLIPRRVDSSSSLYFVTYTHNKNAKYESTTICYSSSTIIDMTAYDYVCFFMNRLINEF